MDRIPASTAAVTFHGTPYGVIVARDSHGTQLATAFNGRDGWAVTRQHEGRMHQICVATEEDARTMLRITAEVMAG
jgi:hypothetical protein